MTFEEMAIKSNNTIMHIEENGLIIARGIHIENSLLTFKDNDISVISYPDTGTFVLFKGSNVFSRLKKHKNYVDDRGYTKTEIVFQSKNAAAEFVLGKKGRTNHWKSDNPF